jgi:hypothetical protein
VKNNIMDIQKSSFKKVFTIIIFIYTINLSGQTVWEKFTSFDRITIELPNYFSKGILVAGGTLQWFNNSLDNNIQLNIESFGNGTIKDLNDNFKTDLLNEKNVTYKVKKNKGYVISGINEDGIFYNKSIIKNGIQYHLRIIYQTKNKDLVESLIGKISSSFK